MRTLRDRLNEGTRLVGNRIHNGLGNYLTRDVNLKKSFRNVAVGASMLAALATGTYTIVGNPQGVIKSVYL